jgi:hypothetical protein
LPEWKATWLQIGERQSQRRRAVLIRECANCDDPLDGPEAVSRGPSSAWHHQCLACHELVSDQLEVVENQPGGAPIQIHRCRRCDSVRACRPGWTTRCHICLDERSAGSLVTQAGSEALNLLNDDPALAHQARQFLGLAPDQEISLRGAVESQSYVTLADEMSRRARPGWAVLAADVYRLPWTGIRAADTSNGAWGRHDRCGILANLRPGTVDCPTCGPEPGSRTHLAGRDTPYLLYLVRTHRSQKFGVGDERRVRTHLRNGAEVMEVLEAPFEQVVLAETTLKRHHEQKIPGRPRRGMAESFGQGTEVTRHRTLINLTDVLLGAKEVTSWFR